MWVSLSEPHMHVYHYYEKVTVLMHNIYYNHVLFVDIQQRRLCQSTFLLCTVLHEL